MVLGVSPHPELGWAGVGMAVPQPDVAAALEQWPSLLPPESGLEVVPEVALALPGVVGGPALGVLEDAPHASVPMSFLRLERAASSVSQAVC